MSRKGRYRSTAGACGDVVSSFLYGRIMKAGGLGYFTLVYTHRSYYFNISLCIADDDPCKACPAKDSIKQVLLSYLGAHQRAQS